MTRFVTTKMRIKRLMEMAFLLGKNDCSEEYFKEKMEEELR
jgi:hypothetical protein